MKKVYINININAVNAINEHILWFLKLNDPLLNFASMKLLDLNLNLSIN